jgi:predicted NAD-dependent protein-ADP-ribosyltransferase YbiA (DUF1768 family)
VLWVTTSDHMASSYRVTATNQVHSLLQHMPKCRLDVDLGTQFGLLVANAALTYDKLVEATLPDDYTERLSVREARLARKIAMGLPSLHTAPRSGLPDSYQQVHSVLSFWSGKPIGNAWGVLRQWALQGRQAIVLTPAKEPTVLGGERLRLWLGYMPPGKRVMGLDGAWAPLSLTWDAPLEWNGRVWSSAEHAFQATRAASAREAEWVGKAATPQEARRRGLQVAPRPDWDQISSTIIGELLIAKFNDPCFAGILLSTGEATIVDTSRGSHTSNGNVDLLGPALMRLRDQLRSRSHASARAL